MKGILPKIIRSARPYGLKNMTNPATNAAAIAMTTIQIQIEALASSLSSPSFSSLVCRDTNADRMIMETKPSWECEEQALGYLFTLQRSDTLVYLKQSGKTNPQTFLNFTCIQFNKKAAARSLILG
jgi:hypothetical protein